MQSQPSCDADSCQLGVTILNTHTHTHTHTHTDGQRFVEGMDVPVLE